MTPRIIAGKHRGRPLRVPPEAVRPTAGRVRQALFDVLEHGIDWPGFDGADVLDVFAGSGACGLEALSRGAVHATFVDSDAAALLTIRRNAASIGEAWTVALLKLDATRLPPPPGAAKAPCALAFLDPPYDSGLATPALQSLAMRCWLAPGAIAVVEVSAREPLTLPPGFALLDERVHGAARLVFLRLGEPATSAASSDRR
jgi:16S rRNA (guanine966-N2)-methyltransferase